MANKEHVKILKKGVAEWNEWRRSVPTERPTLEGADLTGAHLTYADLSNATLRHATLTVADLTGANLTYADLSNANLPDATLTGANLTGANLSGARLTFADLTGANLTGTNLSRANLTGANLPNVDLTDANLTIAQASSVHLTYANLTGANLCFARLAYTDLSNADLTRANLSIADLSNANLTKASLHSTVFASLDLTSVIGLEKCVHRGPSTIDIQTLQRSHTLPISFLRGIGLPDNLIDYLPSLLNQAIQHYSCFISYSAKDEDFAKRIHADLQNSGVRCWFAPHDLRIGAKIWDAIDEAINLRDKVLLILSKNAIDSDWVEDEVQKAFAEERDRKSLVLFPVRIDDAAMETQEPWARKLRDQRNIGDFRNWKDHDEYKMSFECVLRDLTKHDAEGG